MFTYKIYEGPKLLDVIHADCEEDAWAHARRISDRPKALRLVFGGVTPANVIAPFLNDIPDEIWQEVG